MDDVTVYDDATNTWTDVGHLFRARSYHGMALVSESLADYCVATTTTTTTTTTSTTTTTTTTTSTTTTTTTTTSTTTTTTTKTTTAAQCSGSDCGKITFTFLL